ncbi:hypothetical protein Mterra_03975 [Calidithermus terrae]|uniref:DinB-like domain-containing protein n=1 Tax=Calidithermus terrae TaxID=1408545 RepID=A0A399DZZ5_9DEIN|nr:DinB family protein [Calidithermus terrae]RIH75502.1 hypothetical protein Mterra_03975 [Calidithermus terrae]
MRSEQYPEFSLPALGNVLVHSLKMALEGDEHNGGWYNGLLFALENVSAEQASRAPAEGRATVAAHAEHVRFTLEVANAWLRGERPEINWADSWKVQQVSEAEWEALKAGLRQQYETLLEMAHSRPTWREPGVALMIDNIAHTAYHAGAIRQMVKLVQGGGR